MPIAAGRGRRFTHSVMALTIAMLAASGLIYRKEFLEQGEEWYAALNYGDWIRVEFYDISDLMVSPPQVLARVARRIGNRKEWNEPVLVEGKLVVRANAREQLRVKRLLTSLREGQDNHGP